jgi:hypothetical protein
VDRTPFTQPAVTEENTGAVFFNFEGIPVLYILLSDLAVTQLKMASEAIDIGGGNKES